MTRAESDDLLQRIIQSIIDSIVPIEEGTYGVNSEDASEWLWKAFQARMAEAVQAERERCAKIVETMETWHPSHTLDIATAVRRGH